MLPPPESWHVVQPPVVIEEVLRVEQAACAKLAVRTKIAMQDEDQRPLRIEEPERDTLHTLGFGREDAGPAVLAAAPVTLLQGALDEPSPCKARPNVQWGCQDRRLSGDRCVRP